MKNDINMTIRDIKPLIEIPDNSFYIYWGLIIISVILIISIIFFLIFLILNWWRVRKINLAKGYLSKLKDIDWQDTKASAYSATHYSRLLATDERRQKLFEQLNPMLDKYKYKKKVDFIDDETMKYFNLFVQVTDESL